MRQHKRWAVAVLSVATTAMAVACSANAGQPIAASTAPVASSGSVPVFASETSLRFSYPPGQPTELTDMSWDPVTPDSTVTSDSFKTPVSTEQPRSQPAPTQSMPQSVTARIAAFDPTTGALTYVNQYLIDPPDTQGYLADDPNDPAEHVVVLSPDAEIRFVYSSCSNLGGTLVPGGVACTAADLAGAVATQFVATLVVIDGTVVELRQIYQA